MKQTSKLIIGALACISCLAAPASFAQSKKATASATQPAISSVTVSDYEFNSFIAPVPIKRIFFPGGSPVSGKPVYLSDNKLVMLQFSKGATTPVQMVLELDNGSVLTLRVTPKTVPGITYSLKGAVVPVAAEPRGLSEESLSESAIRGKDVELIKVLVSTNSPPDGFEPVRLPSPTVFDKFTVVPLAAWTDGNYKKLMVFSIVAADGQTAVVAPPQFYRPGITAVSMDGDVVDDKNSPQMYVVEDLSDE